MTSPDLRPLRWLATLLLALIASTALAHDARPIYINLSEDAPNRYLLQGKVPATVPRHAVPEVAMPGHCQPTTALQRGQTGESHLFRGQFQCADDLRGSDIALRYPDINPSLSVLLRLDLADGTRFSQILPPGETHWRVPAIPSALAIIGQYSAYGVEHIFAGLDHLLFVACLLFIARTPRKILLTITGFTLAHSFTLALATLEVVTPPVPPVEAAIALSIVFLAHEIAVGDKASWTWRYPVLVSTTFGLLHGFGFAALLKDLGLPTADIGLALLFFNLGVEAGQLLFIATLSGFALTLAKLLRTSPHHLLDRRATTIAGSYVIGILGSLWLIQRIAAFA